MTPKKQTPESPASPEGHSLSARRVVRRRQNPRLKLYEISALVDYHSVILAVSAEDALKHVSTWEQAWHENADLAAVSDVQITDIRPLKSSDWSDEAHGRTRKAANEKAVGRRLPAASVADTKSV